MWSCISNASQHRTLKQLAESSSCPPHWVRALLASLPLTAAHIWAGTHPADMAVWSQRILVEQWLHCGLEPTFFFRYTERHTNILTTTLNQTPLSILTGTIWHCVNSWHLCVLVLSLDLYFRLFICLFENHPDNVSMLLSGRSTLEMWRL